MGKKELTNKASILFSVKPKHSSLPSNKIVNETKKNAETLIELRRY